MSKDTILYDILQVSPNALESDIKKSFYKLSKLYHPDKHPDNLKEEYTKKFLEITRAKEILLDPNKRKIYDSFGIDNVKINEKTDPTNQFDKEFENINNVIELSLEQLFNGGEISFDYIQKKYCVDCNGIGSIDKSIPKCNICNGSGIKIVQLRQGAYIQIMHIKCDNCDGSGKCIVKKCDKCSGDGYITNNKTLKIPLRAGLEDGQKIIIEDKGNHYYDDGKVIKTDLILTIIGKPHDRFRKYKYDLIMKIELDLTEALFGYSKIIKHLDETNILIESNKKTEYNQVRIIPKQGMKIISNEIDRGDLYIIFTYKLPSQEFINNIPSEIESYFLQQSNKPINEKILKCSTKITNDCDINLSKSIIKIIDMVD